MNHSRYGNNGNPEAIYPIYTEATECHDCYKCVRQCPVKAIRIENGVASVLSNRCIACGHCVQVCPSRAKRVRNDLSRAVDLLAGESRVYVSLAPSWRGLFPEWSASSLVTALKTLGVTEVSETALGAQEVSAAVAEQISQEEKGLFISSACPAVVDYIRRYHPWTANRIVSLASPALTHCAMLRKLFGEDIRVIFIGPCVAKKNEADRHPELLDCALTFEELRILLDDQNLVPSKFAGSQEHFIPETAAEGAIYPIEGGMLETIRRCDVDSKVLLQSISGIPLLAESLDHLREMRSERPIFLEALACPGGCINGPFATRASHLAATTGILEQANYREREKRSPVVRVEMEYEPLRVEEEVPDEASVRKALLSLGKTSPADELNCSGCGYESCREFAKALVRGDAEPEQCVSHMRRVATRKANALLRCIPAGIAIVDSNLLIVESNEAFSRLFGEEIIQLYQDVPGLEGADITTLLPCGPLFEAALRQGEDIRREHYPVGDQLLDLTIFTIDPGKTIGVVVQDVTETELGREQIAERADEVISRNIAIVQEIASRLGEHMADTEILLDSISRGYRKKK
ncbi:MAG: [Fe-Fe] hydrogenase large subunit C-terminal domain-containing protein [Planctomycetia bacterium]|nr:[Fe-Fe] hydrogenase large subunit C-terminal domain-containing protein [Planctomycetia bacterium]